MYNSTINSSGVDYIDIFEMPYIYDMNYVVINDTLLKPYLTLLLKPKPISLLRFHLMENYVM